MSRSSIIEARPPAAKQTQTTSSARCSPVHSDRLSDGIIAELNTNTYHMIDGTYVRNNNNNKRYVFYREVFFCECQNNNSLPALNVYIKHIYSWFHHVDGPASISDTIRARVNS